MHRTHAEPNWRATGWGQPEIGKTETKSKQGWFCLLVVLSLSALSALVIYGIFHLPLEFRLLALAIISVLMFCIEKCCVKKNALDTQTGTRNGTRTGTGNRTGTRNRTRNGTTGNSEEFILYDLQL